MSYSQILGQEGGREGGRERWREGKRGKGEECYHVTTAILINHYQPTKVSHLSVVVTFLAVIISNPFHCIPGNPLVVHDG